MLLDGPREQKTDSPDEGPEHGYRKECFEGHRLRLIGYPLAIPGRGSASAQEVGGASRASTSSLIVYWRYQMLNRKVSIADGATSERLATRTPVIRECS
jgi:hypothetical protein